jgi:hypothetical protein
MRHKRKKEFTKDGDMAAAADILTLVQKFKVDVVKPDIPFVDEMIDTIDKFTLNLPSTAIW